MNYKNDVSFVFDLGLMFYEQQELKLSDAYEKEWVQPELELTVTVYNINRGHNLELLNAC